PVRDGDEAPTDPGFRAGSVLGLGVSQGHRHGIIVRVPPLRDVWLVPPSDERRVVVGLVTHDTDRDLAVARDLVGIGQWLAPPPPRPTSPPRRGSSSPQLAF